MAKAITRFDGEYSFLSNFYPSDRIVYDRVAYRTVEHAYVAAKSLDVDFRQEVWDTPTPGQAKRLGREVELRADWDDIKLDVMKDLIHQKFQNTVLRQQLIATNKSMLVEGNTWGDTFWGVCKNTGQNHLGRILMDERFEIRLEEAGLPIYE